MHDGLTTDEALFATLRHPLGYSADGRDFKGEVKDGDLHDNPSSKTHRT